MGFYLIFNEMRLKLLLSIVGFSILMTQCEPSKEDVKLVDDNRVKYLEMKETKLSEKLKEY